MELLLIEQPCRIEEVLTLNYSFDNLHKFLNFLVLSDKESSDKLIEVNLKLSDVDIMKNIIDEVTKRLSTCETTNTNMDITMNSFFQKFSELDNKIFTALQVIITYKKKKIFFEKDFFN